MTRLDALQEYAKASEQLLTESDRRGLYPAAGCHRHVARGEAPTDVHPILDDADTDPLAELVEIPAFVLNDSDEAYYSAASVMPSPVMDAHGSHTQLTPGAVRCIEYTVLAVLAGTFCGGVYLMYLGVLLFGEVVAWFLR